MAWAWSPEGLNEDLNLKRCVMNQSNGYKQQVNLRLACGFVLIAEIKLNKYNKLLAGALQVLIPIIPCQKHRMI